MTLHVIKWALALTILSVATTAAIAVLPAKADSADPSAAGTDIARATPRQPKTPPDAGPLVGNAVLAVSLAKLSMTRERPIFSTSRRPPPAPAPPPIVKLMEPAKPAEPEQPPLVLVGTVAGEDSGIAVFVEQSTENTVKLRVNEAHQGWILQSVQGREVTLLKGRKSSILALAPPGGAEPARAQAALDPPKRLPRR
jgi:hypothetical protein